MPAYAIYKTLRRHFGFRDWWPGDSQFEVFVGAILTQQTTWGNVEKAILNLKRHNALDMGKIAKMPVRELQGLVRPSGYYRQKARRLKSICRSITKEHGSLSAMLELDKEELRRTLLSYNGIGMETADSIILYAAQKPIFVIDAYTKRAMHRIDPNISEGIEYDDLRAYFESSIKRDVTLYKDFHAQFVELGKSYCRKSKPLCHKCPVRKSCSFGSTAW
ncbi:MAG: endonuclease III domain-containing protein [Candidatus Micrarchaeaceae archaeon]